MQSIVGSGGSVGGGGGWVGLGVGVGVAAGAQAVNTMATARITPSSVVNLFLVDIFSS
jgi:hypothetical protein